MGWPILFLCVFILALRQALQPNTVSLHPISAVLIPSTRLCRTAPSWTPDLLSLPLNSALKHAFSMCCFSAVLQGVGHRRELALLEDRCDELRNHVARCEAALDEAKQARARVEEDCEFRLTIAEESKQTLSAELQQAYEEADALRAEKDRAGDDFARQRDQVDDMKQQVMHHEQENARLAQKIKEWHDEAERLQQELDRRSRTEFDFHTESDAQLKRMRLECHELREQRASLEVERNMLASAKLDLAQEVNRLKRRAEEREEQVKRLLRILEDKDQTIAEMGPAMKASRRAAATVRAANAKGKQESGWKY
eukprot:m.804157 g.804157  ORF g.804157 m.804157 type:complete len:311 (-) comp23368_c0_seq14:1348-2280(-)